MKTNTRIRVRAGIAFLNAVNPNWKKKIKLGRLDLSNSRTCVIGEVYGSYYDGMEEVGIEGDSDVAIVLGFKEIESFDTNYPLLTKVWKQELRKIL